MKIRLGSVLLLVVSLLCGGCLVRALHPWLPEETRVADPSIAGAWHDAEKECVVFFNAGAATNYAVLMVQEGKDLSRFGAALHRIDDTLLLMVGPEDRTDLGAFATLPGHLLYKAVLAGDSLTLFAVDLDSFAERARKAKIDLLPGSSGENGCVLLPPTEELAAFVQAQLAQPGFFADKPFFSLRKLPASP